MFRTRPSRENLSDSWYQCLNNEFWRTLPCLSHEAREFLVDAVFGSEAMRTVLTPVEKVAAAITSWVERDACNGTCHRQASSRESVQLLVAL
jgi:hypothetical protein